jgi:hypothetical protein
MYVEVDGNVDSLDLIEKNTTNWTKTNKTPCTKIQYVFLDCIYLSWN